MIFVFFPILLIFYGGNWKHLFALTSIVLSPGQTNSQVVESSLKLNFRTDMRGVAKRAHKFPRKYTEVAEKRTILRLWISYFIGW